MSASAQRAYSLKRLFVAGDVLALGVSFAAMAGAAAIEGTTALTAAPILIFAASVPFWIVLAHGMGLYHLSERRVDQTFVDEVWPTLVTTTLWAWCLVVASAAAAPGAYGVSELVILWSAAIPLLLSMRALARRIARGREWFRQHVLLIGDSDDVDRLLRRIARHPDWGLEPAAAVRINGSTSVWVAGGIDDQDLAPEGETTPSPEQLAEFVRSAGVSRAVVAGWPGNLSERTDLIRVLARTGICVDLVSAEPEALCSTGVLHHIEGLPMLTVRPARITPLWMTLKRVMDVAVSSCALMLLTPAFAYFAIRIKLDSPGPVLFRQQRAGRDNRPFELLKFRTMYDGADAVRRELRLVNGDAERKQLFKLRHDERVTRFGLRLRRWSLDELPQLWNVLRGDMSLVGPRPLPLDEAEMASGHWAERLKVRPGMTGPWQIHGRSDIPFDEMVKLDYTYVAAWRMGEDMRLLARTIGAVLARRGAY
jgi:exopolysaccharide biosynthesis polyprenyl glycosylphosphotransferase